MTRHLFAGEMTTERLYYTDSYLGSFRARIVDSRAEGREVVLDRSAFYPASGGQPFDLGWIGDAEILDVRDEEGGMVHVLSKPVSGVSGKDDVECSIDWRRRFDHMQQHTGQHLLSAVLAEMFGVQTVSFHMGSGSSTIDLACPHVSAEQIQAAEAQANRIVHENRSVTVVFEEAETAADLRKASEREGTLRIVSIEGMDRSACGGTHVRMTGEIGLILLRSVEKVRGNVRLEFLCGSRAVARARADYAALEKTARTFSAALDEVPALVAAQAERVKDSEKTRRRLEGELAEQRGKALYAGSEVDESGLRVHERILDQSFPDDLRPEAGGFVSQKRSVFAAVSRQPQAVLLAASEDSGIHCGNVLKQILSEFGGKGGGSAPLAQGSFTGDPNALLKKLRALLRLAAE